MGKLLQIISKLILFGSAASVVAVGAAYCSLEVRVVNDAGQDIEATVKVAEPRRKVREQLFEGEPVRFCDLGILPVKVTVGVEGCNRVVIEDVHLDWGETAKLLVVYRYYPCDRKVVQPPGCSVLLRVQSANGWLKDIPVFKGPDKGLRMGETDEYGRLMLRLTPNSHQDLLIDGGALGNAMATVDCVPGKPLLEQSIVLR